MKFSINKRQIHRARAGLDLSRSLERERLPLKRNDGAIKFRAVPDRNCRQTFSSFISLHFNLKIIFSEKIFDEYFPIF